MTSAVVATSVLLALFTASAAAALPPTLVNVIDGTDDRGVLTALGPKLGLSLAEITHIRKVSGHVGCFEPVPKVGSGALYITNDQILTAGHIFFDGSKRQTKCYFRAQTAGAEWMPLKTDAASVRFGAIPPKPGSNADWAVVQLAAPIAGVAPFPVDTSTPAAGDALIVITAHPVGLEQVPLDVPVAQGCKVRRAPKSSSTTSFYRTDCDASSGSSGGMNLFRASGELVFRGMVISTGPSELAGAAYDEKAGSVTTMLGTDAAILAAGRELAGK